MKLIRPVKITDSGGSFSRSSTATYFSRTGVLSTATNDTPRVTFVFDENISTWILYGVLLEPTATNLLLNSALPTVAQTLTV